MSLLKKIRAAKTSEIICWSILGGFGLLVVVVFLVTVITLIFPPRFMLRRTEQRRAFAQKAGEKIAECKVLGDRRVTRSGKVLVFSGEAEALLDPTTVYWPDPSLVGNLILHSPGTDPSDGPVTVFLTEEHKVQVGKYSISGAAAYRRWVEIYVVQFRNFTDSGTAVAAHTIEGLAPPGKRQVTQYEGYGNMGQPIADWIRSLPTK